MTSVPIERRGDYIVKMYELHEEVCRQLLTRCKLRSGWPSAVLTKD